MVGALGLQELVLLAGCFGLPLLAVVLFFALRGAAGRDDRRDRPDDRDD